MYKNYIFNVHILFNKKLCNPLTFTLIAGEDGMQVPQAIAHGVAEGLKTEPDLKKSTV